MAIDMKQIIADGLERLMFDKKVKKLTVKDIVEECNISRQAFYYHFSGIPELLQWRIETRYEQMLEACLKKGDLESSLNYVFSIVISMRPALERGLRTNYGDDMEKMMNTCVHKFFGSIFKNYGLYQNYSPEEQDLIISYHCNALIGITQERMDREPQNMEKNAHLIYRLIAGEVPSR